MDDVDVQLVHLDPDWPVRHTGHSRASRLHRGCRGRRICGLTDEPRGRPQDLFPIKAAPLGLTCRLYSGREGMGGSPTVVDLVAALKRRSPS